MGLIDLIDKIEAPTHKSFLDSLKPKDRDDLLEIRRRLQAGEYESFKTAAFISKSLADKVGTSKSNLSRWLRELSNAEATGGRTGKPEGGKRSQGAGKVSRKTR